MTEAMKARRIAKAKEAKERLKTAAYAQEIMNYKFGEHFKDFETRYPMRYVKLVDS